MEDKSLFKNQTNNLKDILKATMVNKFKGHRIWQSEILFGTSIAQSSDLKSGSASILLHDRPEIRYDILHVVVSGLF